ncbi:hypothetical protein DNX69_15565 [Rhodopseudomonas palustris]|uniref:DUF4238 domain-containing protein n=1 Tax=Rhodopseudomonas palustris TaxID=1076 RepID=A0A323UDH3_RHOPL|nr:DUF4238 domain-containing protein [Rhodopseudomonas palustris]PZA10764.1 hypothetical protein DNX69_15565 [Rhodopseudomonas palustris]
MNANQRRKRRHHHVWQTYLRPWTTDRGLFCLQDGRVFPSGTRVLAVQTDFYKLQRLTPHDLTLLKLLFGQGHPAAVRTHASLVAGLIAPFESAERFRGSPNWSEIEAQLDEHASNVLEDYHASIESSFRPSLERALAGDLGFYADDDECITFLNYLCTQYLRTRGIKERVLELSPALERVWNVIIHIAATNVGASLYLERKRRKLVVVQNFSKVPFVVSDQPAINLKGRRPVPTDRLSIYYPISPTAALLMADVDEEPLFSATGLTAEQANELNHLVVRAAHLQVFARSASCLERYADVR